MRIEIPLELPEGTLYEGFFGLEDKDNTVNISNPLKTTSFKGGPISAWGAMCAPAGVPMDMKSSAINLAKWFFSLFVIIFMFVTICGIIQYLLARKNKEKVQKAKRVFFSGIIGFVILGFVYFLMIVSMAVFSSGSSMIISAIAILFLSGVAIKTLFGTIKSGEKKNSKILSHIFVLIVVLAVISGLLYMLDILRLPIIVFVAILILTYSKKLSWRKALLISTLGMVLHYASISYSLISIVKLNSEIISGVSLSSKILMFMPVILFVAYLISLTGLFFKRRCAFAFTITLTIFIVIRILFSGAWPITAIGWSILVFMIIPGLYFTRGDFRKK